jgi:hypothetical protein
MVQMISCWGQLSVTVAPCLAVKHTGQTASLVVMSWTRTSQISKSRKLVVFLIGDHEVTDGRCQASTPVPFGHKLACVQLLARTVCDNSKQCCFSSYHQSQHGSNWPKKARCKTKDERQNLVKDVQKCNRPLTGFDIALDMHLASYGTTTARWHNPVLFAYPIPVCDMKL